MPMSRRTTTDFNIIPYKQKFMIHNSTSIENKIQVAKMQPELSLKCLPVISKTRHWAVLFVLTFFLLSASFSKAQDVFLGLTSNGGPEGRGTAFSIKNNGTNFAITKAFADWGKTPNGDLIQSSDGNFYGMTSTGGTYTYGSIFKVTPAGVITILH